jgi:SIR2-like domain
MQLSERQWKNLARDLQLRRCVLFLGNRLVAGAGDIPLSALLSEHLTGILEQEGIAFEKSSAGRLHYTAQRFMTIPKIRRIDLEDEVETFYRANARQIPELYRRLAQLPFALVVNTTPDDLMLRAFHTAGKAGARLLHYNFRRERNSVVGDISSDNPLVYNLLGTLDDPESLVLSQEDRVEFIKNVVRGNPSVPNAVMGYFDERKTYIFLGFNLENWDARLLMDSFKLSKDNTTVSPQSDNYPLRPETQSFFEDRYRFVFVEQEIGAFIAGMDASFQTVSAEKTPAKTRLEVQKKLVILHADNDLDHRCCQKLLKHLKPWAEEGWIEIWRPDLIAEGNIADQTRAAIAAADLLAPILSADFLADAGDVILDALEAHRQRGVLIAPLLYRACPWDETPLAPFHPLPDRSRPLQNWPDADEAYTLVAKRIKSMLSHD